MQEFKGIDSCALEHVHGGISVWGATKLVGRGAGKLLGWPLTVGMAAYDAYQGGAAEARRGGSTGSIAREAGLEALNSVTFGASNWALGRP